MSTIDLTVKYATNVDSLSAAWEFVMAHVDELGEAPTVSISPVWDYQSSEEGVLRFDVGVSGSTEVES